MFYLKGNRKYLHSTDIISYIFAKYKKIKSLDIKFYKIITGNPRLKIINKKVSSIKYDCVANLDLESKRLISLIFSGTKKKIVQSYSYNEELLYVPPDPVQQYQSIRRCSPHPASGSVCPASKQKW